MALLVLVIVVVCFIVAAAAGLPFIIKYIEKKQLFSTYKARKEERDRREIEVTNQLRKSSFENFKSNHQLSDLPSWVTQEEVEIRLHKGADPATWRGIYIGGGHYFNEPGHILTVGGSRAGKGANLILPALLSERISSSNYSLVVLDPKGENLDVAGHHLEAMGYEVHCINPFGIDRVKRFGNSRFNPLSYSDVIDNQRLCDIAATAMLPPTGEKMEHFQTSGNQYLSNYMLHMVTKYPEDISFEKLYAWVRYGGERRIKLLAEMAGNEKSRSVRQNAEAIASQLLETKGDEVGSIYSTMRRGTDFLKHDPLVNTLSGDDVDFRDLAKKPIAIFLCMEPGEIIEYKEFVRLFFALIMALLPKIMDPKGKRKVLLLMDEFAQLGYLKEFEIGFDTLAGYNVTIWAIIQQLGQLEEIYGKRHEGFIGSSVVKHFLGVGDITTAEYIKKTMPEEYIVWFKNRSEIDYKTRPLLTESDIIHFDSILCQIRGLRGPAKFDFAPYYNNSGLSENAKKKPSEMEFKKEDMVYDDYVWNKDASYNFLTDINKDGLTIVDRSIGNHMLWIVNSLIKETWKFDAVERDLELYRSLETIIREKVPSDKKVSRQILTWVDSYINQLRQEAENTQNNK